jgi:hypothetical protein
VACILVSTRTEASVLGTRQNATIPYFVNIQPASNPSSIVIHLGDQVLDSTPARLNSCGVYFRLHPNRSECSRYKTKRHNFLFHQHPASLTSLFGHPPFRGSSFRLNSSSGRYRQKTVGIAYMCDQSVTSSPWVSFYLVNLQSPMNGLFRLLVRHPLNPTIVHICFVRPWPTMYNPLVCTSQFNSQLSCTFITSHLVQQRHNHNYNQKRNLYVFDFAFVPKFVYPSAVNLFSSRLCL